MKKFHQALTFTLFLVELLTSCQQQPTHTASEYFKEKHFTLLEPPEIEEHYFTDSLKSYWKADTSDLYSVEQIIISALNDLQTKNFTFSEETLPNFMRQYVCFINRKGERMIWVNAHCRLEKIPPDIDSGETEFKAFDWRNKLAIVDDGGDCHWSILINLDKKTYSDFSINGV